MRGDRLSQISTDDEAGNAPLLGDVTRSVALDPLVAASEVPRAAGIYAAWIVSDAALHALGIAGPAPVLMYVGKAAGGRGNLRRRLTVHSRVPFYELIELLAIRGHTIFPWHARAYTPGSGRMYRASPLAQLATDAGMRFQHTHLRWAWRSCDADEARVLERRAIASGRPLLNRAGAGSTPPQMRRRDGYERDAACWLWHVAWAALYVGSSRDPSWRYGDPASAGWALGHSGWPQPCATDDAIEAPRLPAHRKVRRLIRSAAKHESVPSVVREAVNQASPEELDIWWAAHAGTGHLKPPIDPHDAIRNALVADPRRRVPEPPTRATAEDDALLRLIRGLQRVAH